MRNVLFISYYFPPSMDPGSKRTLGFFRHLPDHGYDPRLVTVRNGNYWAIEPPATAPEDGVIRVTERRRLPWPRRTSQIVEPARVRRAGMLRYPRLRRLYRQLFYIPDGYRGFFRPAIDASLSLIDRHRVDVILTTSSPFTTLWIGYRLTRATGIPWIADLRDLWIDNPFGEQSRWRRALDQRLEARWLSHAKAITTATEGVREAIRRRYEWDNVHCVYNGFLESADSASAPAADFTGELHIVFTGKMYEHPGHSIRPICEALVRLRAIDPGSFAGVKLTFLGVVNSEFDDITHAYGLSDRIRFLGFVTPAEVAKVQRGGDVLLVLLPATHHIFVPTKVFEYLAARRPILFIGPDSEAAQLIRSRQAGYARLPDDIDGITGVLSHLVREKRLHGALHSGASKDAIDEFSYRSLAGRLAAVLDSVVDPSSTTRPVPRRAPDNVGPHPRLG